MPVPPATARASSPAGVLSSLAVLAGSALASPLSPVLVLAWARWTGTPAAEFGFARPRSWARIVLVGVPAGIAFKLLMKSAVMPLLGAPAVNPAFRWVTGNPAALPGMLFAILAGAAVGEETLFRGFLFERLRRLLGGSRAATAGIVVLTSVLFAAAHYQLQKLAGVQQALFTGLLLGAVYARTRQLWLPMVIHAAFDLTALALVYWGLEQDVARWFFH